MHEFTASDVVGRARGLLESAYYSFLITTGEAGEPSARLVQHFKPTEDLTLWYGTIRGSRKVRELEARPRALIACQSPKTPAYVVLSGAIRIREEPEVRQRYWQEMWRRFWPQGPLSDEYLVLEFRCERVELIDFSSNPIAPHPYGMSPAVVLRTGDGWALEYPSGARRGEAASALPQPGQEAQPAVAAP